jgi:hypothetical protein
MYGPISMHRSYTLSTTTVRSLFTLALLYLYNIQSKSLLKTLLVFLYCTMATSFLYT